MFVIKTYVMWDKYTKSGAYSALVNNKIVSGGKAHTTWQRCELMAIIAAIKKLPVFITLTHVKIDEPSSYVAHAMSEMKNYITRAIQLKSCTPLASNNRPIRNTDLWLKLIETAKAHNIHLDY